MSLNLFNVLESKKILNIYKQTLNDMDEYFVYSVNHSPYKEVKTRIIDAVRKDLSSWRLGYYEEPNHKIPMLYAIVDVSRGMLLSGGYHTYRATLGIDGKELLRVFDTATTMLVHLKKTDKNDIKAARKELMDGIELIG